jgi:hypothetical protein
LEIALNTAVYDVVTIDLDFLEDIKHHFLVSNLAFLNILNIKGIGNMAAWNHVVLGFRSEERRILMVVLGKSGDDQG